MLLENTIVIDVKIPAPEAIGIENEKIVAVIMVVIEIILLVIMNCLHNVIVVVMRGVEVVRKEMIFV
eukprot:13307405-Ditylum_brightwellii.AAC.1